MRASVLATIAALAGISQAHLAAWHPSMWCFDGNTAGLVDYNTYTIVNPLYQMAKKDWWFHGVDRCNEFPPQAGQFLELPAGGSFQMEIAGNRGKTSFSFNGRYASDYTDGANYNFDPDRKECITTPNIHTESKNRAAGTAFAIAYVSELDQVTEENLAVFSVRYHTPFERITHYDVPAAMPACPPGGCICAWAWTPRACGIPNQYMNGYRCKVTGATSTAPVLPAKPPVWCEGDTSKCTQGARQLIYWNQAEGNNIQVDGYDLQGEHKSPGYNMNTGFVDGPQNEIFGSSPVKAVTPAPAPVQVAPIKAETSSPAAAAPYQPPAAEAPAPSPAAPSPAPSPVEPSKAAEAAPISASPSNTPSSTPRPAMCPTRRAKRAAAKRAAVLEAEELKKRSAVLFHRRHTNQFY